MVVRPAAIEFGVHLPHLPCDPVPAQPSCNSLSVHRLKERVEIKVNNLGLASHWGSENSLIVRILVISVGPCPLVLSCIPIPLPCIACEELFDWELIPPAESFPEGKAHPAEFVVFGSGLEIVRGSLHILARFVRPYELGQEFAMS